MKVYIIMENNGEDWEDNDTTIYGVFIDREYAESIIKTCERTEEMRKKKTSKYDCYYQRSWFIEEYVVRERSND